MTLPDPVWLGRRPFVSTLADMQRIVAQRHPPPSDQVWALEHDRVLTLGISAQHAHVRDPGDLPVVLTDRGGSATWHGPGQLMFYPMIDLTRAEIGPRALVRGLEYALLSVLRKHSIAAELGAAPGVFVGPAKLASIGLRVVHGRSYHGMAVNVSCDLDGFDRIDPCGMAGQRMTRLIDHGWNPPLPALAQDIARAFVPVRHKKRF